MLYLAVSVMCSSTGVASDGPIEPDVLAVPPDDLSLARAWLTAP